MGDRRRRHRLDASGPRDPIPPDRPVLIFYSRRLLCDPEDARWDQAGGSSAPRIPVSGRRRLDPVPEGLQFFVPLFFPGGRLLHAGGALVPAARVVFYLYP